MTAQSDTYYMQKCLELAQNGEFSAKPNPCVGCLIVKDDHILAEGWHQFSGQGHAEVNALKNMSASPVGAHLYVSLEPCSHHGKTPPCCDSIIESGITKVVFGMQDPNPNVAGQGIEKLRQAGIEVVGPVLESECINLNRGFVERMQTGRPYVRCKMAMSTDGRTAMASGESKWITGKQAREDVQLWRARSGAVITGIGTILSDDPSLNARLENETITQPLRVVCDSQQRLPARAKILNLDGEVLQVTASDNPLAEGVKDDCVAKFQSISIPGSSNQIDLEGLLEYLAQEQQINEVLIEAGATLAGAFIKAGLVDELIIYIAPKLLGHEALPLFEIPGLNKIEDQVSLEFTEVSLLGKDCRMRTRILKNQ